MDYLTPILRAAACLALLLPLAALPGVAEQVRGRVESEDGVPIPGARVADLRGGEPNLTDDRGEFVIECADPCVLRVGSPWFGEQEVHVDRLREVVIQLSASRLTEEVVVIASRGVGDSSAPVSVATTLLHTDDRLDSPSSLLDLVTAAPAVAENGQGGLFQVISIRGVSRQRVTTLIAGMPVIGDRRAGVSASFVDPLLLEGAEVLRGPASTYYGSGALGGVVHLFPRRSPGLRFQVGYDSFGDENHEVLDWGDGGWSLGLARRSRNNDRAADGSEVNVGFTQYSATAARRWRRGNVDYELLGLASLGDDIGKASNDFPDRRITNYPRERHLLLKFGATTDRGARFQAWIHPNDLRTETLRVGERFTVVDNEAFDLGASYRRRLTLGPRWDAEWGGAYIGRRSVTADERGADVISGPFAEQDLDGDQDEAALFATADWKPGATTVQIGSRFTWHRQHAAGVPARRENGWSGFVGATRPLGRGFGLVANLGSGVRFPSLGERYFSGSTGRGRLNGNPDLRAERSLNTDVGLRWTGRALFVSGQWFRTEIDDYVERIDDPAAPAGAEDVYTFENRVSGTIEGVEIDGLWKPGSRWQLSFGGARIDGDGRDGGVDIRLADVPAHRARLGLRYRQDRWHVSGDYERRASKNDPGSGEMAIPSADLLSAGIEYRIGVAIRLRLHGANLLDEVYFNSADDKSPVAAGRRYGLGLVWQPARKYAGSPMPPAADGQVP